MVDTNVLGKLIKDSRERKKLTQEQLADMVFVTKQAVSNWERGINRPDEATRERLSEVLGIKYDGLSFKGDTKMDIKQIEDINNIDEASSTITAIMKNISLDTEYESTIRMLLEMTLWTVIGYEQYYNVCMNNVDEGYEFDWGVIAWTLRSLINDSESYPFGDFHQMESFYDISGHMIKDKLNCFSYRIGGELFEDFDDDGFRQDYPQIIARYAEQYGYRLKDLLPNEENDIYTMYKVGVYILSEYIDSLNKEK